MPLATVEIAPLVIRMAAPLHVGTGYRRGLIHRTIVRDAENNVYLPASTLKGKVRAACEALLTARGLPACRAPYPKEMKTCRAERCLVCRIFGAPGQDAGLLWHDAALTDDWPRDAGEFGQTSIRTQVALNRARGLAAEGLLYTGEATAPNLVFRSAQGIAGRLELTPLMGDPDAPYELILLLAGLRLVRFLGGAASRGMGLCTIDLPQAVQINNRQVFVDDLLAQVEYLDPEFWQFEEASHG